jgi:CRP-like cAMP-binding protein
MLSSENSSDAVIKVVDFGCAEIIDRKSPYYTPEGNQLFATTPGYSPPEMIDMSRRSTHLDPSVDMFSIGVIIYIMLTGAHPFDLSAQSTDEQINQRILRNIMPPLRNSPITAHLSESAIDLIEKLLDWNPKTRMTALEMLNHPWVKGETAKTGKITDSEKKLKNFRKYKSGLEAQVFASMVQHSDNLNSEDAARKTSLIERSFQMIDSEHRGYITTKDLKRLNTPRIQQIMGDKENDEDFHLSLSGFSDLLSEHMKNVYLPAGHVIFNEGDKGDSMFFINSGRVEVTTKEGFRTITQQGDFFGEGVLLKKGERRSATVKCITPLHAIEIGRNYFEKYLADGFDIELALKERDRVRRQERAKAILGLQHRLNSEAIQKGDYVYLQREEGNDIFLLEDGTIDVDVDGHSVYTVQAGELLGEYATIFGRHRNTSARCASDVCKIEVMELKDFEDIIKSNPSIGKGLREVVFRREFKKALVYATKKPFPQTEKELREAFKRIDYDNSGSIDLDEIRELLRKMDKTFTADDIAQILDSLDLDGAGKIQWKEFKRIFGIHGVIK